MTITTTFARLVSGQIQYAPKPLRVNGSDVYTNDPNIYHANGWYTVILATPLPPVSGFNIEESWREDENTMTVTQVLVYKPIPAPTDYEPNVDERLTDLEAALCDIIDLLSEIMCAMEGGE